MAQEGQRLASVGRVLRAGQRVDGRLQPLDGHVAAASGKTEREPRRRDLDARPTGAVPAHAHERQRLHVMIDRLIEDILAAGVGVALTVVIAEKLVNTRGLAQRTVPRIRRQRPVQTVRGVLPVRRLQGVPGAQQRRADLGLGIGPEVRSLPTFEPPQRLPEKGERDIYVHRPQAADCASVPARPAAGEAGGDT